MHLIMLTVNKDVTSDDGVRILLKQVETQFGDCLIPTTSLSKNVIIGKGIRMYIVRQTTNIL